MSVTPGPVAIPSLIANGRSAAVPGSKTVSMWPIRSTPRPAAASEPGALGRCIVCYPPRRGPLGESRVLGGPHVSRLEPVVKVEVALGRRRPWSGQRRPGRHALARLGAGVLAGAWPTQIDALVTWIRR